MLQNIRDLGYIHSCTGQTIKNGCLFRSTNLSQAKKSELTDISVVIDLRTRQETEENPDKYYDARYLRMPVFDEMTAGISHENGALQNGVPDMRLLYRKLIHHNPLYP